MKNTNIALWRGALEAFCPGDAREAEERRMILELMEKEGEGLLFRDVAYAHLTASSIIVNAGRTKTLMAWHRIYRSWSWTGGHADGEADPEALARREAEEETGIRDLRPIGERPASVEVLPVWAHEKRGHAVGSHLHLNLSYLYEADERLPLRAAPEENSRVGWLDVGSLKSLVSEPDMLPIYLRLLRRANVDETLL